MMKKLIIILFILLLFCFQDDGKSQRSGIQVLWTEEETIFVKGDWFDLTKDQRIAIIDSIYRKNKSYE